jgi:Zn-dependent M28 family amino/carboxypeptidase
MAIGNQGADLLANNCRKGTVTAQLKTSGKMMDSVLSYNVIGELKGSSNPREYIVVGGHLDSWDVGEGAQDDGAGCVQSIEVIRSFKALGIKPRRNVRAVLYMNEENGARGGRAYADSARVKGEKHILAIESDAGGYSPRGIGLEMKPEQRATVKTWAPYFKALNIYEFEGEGGGVDIYPLSLQGTPLAGLSPDPQRYFDVHHTEQDVFEVVNHRELKIGAAALATMVYLADRHGL